MGGVGKVRQNEFPSREVLQPELTPQVQFSYLPALSIVLRLHYTLELPGKSPYLGASLDQLNPRIGAEHQYFWTFNILIFSKDLSFRGSERAIPFLPLHLETLSFSISSLLLQEASVGFHSSSSPGLGPGTFLFDTYLCLLFATAWRVSPWPNLHL